MRSIAAIVSLTAHSLLLAQVTAPQTPATRTILKGRGVAQPTPIQATYSTLVCGFDLKLPVGWVAQAAALASKECRIGLRPPGGGDPTDFPITAVGSAEGLDATAKANGFRSVDGAWFVRGETPTESRASVIEGKGWHGYVGEMEYRADSHGGVYSSIGNGQKALLVGPGDQCLVLELRGGPYDAVFKQLLESAKWVGRERQ